MVLLVRCGATGEVCVLLVRCVVLLVRCVVLLVKCVVLLVVCGAAGGVWCCWWCVVLLVVCGAAVDVVSSLFTASVDMAIQVQEEEFLMKTA